MSFRLQRLESVSQGVKRVAREQLDKALAEIQNDQMDRHETVHQVRKRFKKIRGLIRLVRPSFEKTYRRENAIFRDVGRDLSGVRDAQSLIEAFDRLAGSEQTSHSEKLFAGIREHLVERRKQIAGEQAEFSDVLAGLKEDIHQARTRIADWELKDRGFDAIAGGFEKTYERGQRALGQAERNKATVEDFHEWRKRVKYHWYHCRLLENLWKPMMKARSEEAKHLAELLGEDRDAWLLDQLLEQNAADFPDQAEARAFREIIAKSQKKTRKQAFLLGERLFAEKPKHLSRRLGVWWSTWRDAA
jgi:CHAD domain-containing protein